MIKFFRHFRQAMIKENKVSKYLLYAIGEIALVVVGILIALQVSDWNEQRKYQKQEVKILNQLNADLKANWDEIDGLNDMQIARLRMCDSILVYLKMKRPFNDSLKVYFETINSDGLFNCSNTTYKYIQSQGVNFLSNDTLRTKVTLMYEKDFQNIFWREKNTWLLMREYLSPAYDKLFKSSRASNEAHKNRLIDEASIVYLVNTPIDMNTLHEDEAFINVIVRLRDAISQRVSWVAITLEDLNQLILEIDEETKRLSE